MIRLVLKHPVQGRVEASAEGKRWTLQRGADAPEEGQCASPQAAKAELDVKVAALLAQGYRLLEVGDEDGVREALPAPSAAADPRWIPRTRFEASSSTLRVSNLDGPPPEAAGLLENPPPELRAASRFVVEAWAPRANEGSDLRAWFDALTAAPLPHLRELALGTTISEEAMPASHAGDLGGLLARHPALTSLEVTGTVRSTAALSSDSLERLVLRAPTASAAVVLRLLEARLPALTHLELRLGEDVRFPPEALRQFFERTDLPRLRSLTLVHLEVHGPFVAALAKSKMLAGLKRLELSEWTLASGEDDALAAVAARFKHLEALTLPEETWFQGFDETLPNGRVF
jgi:hypothetical protein